MRSVGFSPNGSLLVSKSDDRTVRMWSVETGELLWAKGHRADVVHAGFSPDGSRVMSHSSDSTTSI